MVLVMNADGPFAKTHSHGPQPLQSQLPDRDHYCKHSSRTRGFSDVCLVLVFGLRMGCFADQGGRNCCESHCVWRRRTVEEVEDEDKEKEGA